MAGYGCVQYLCDASALTPLCTRYFLGLFTTLLFSTWSKQPQPALLYLVPAVLLPVVASAHRKRELGTLWNPGGAGGDSAATGPV